MAGDYQSKNGYQIHNRYRFSVYGGEKEPDRREPAGVQEGQTEDVRMRQRQKKLLEQQREQERKVRRQCLVLGLVCMALTAGVIWRNVLENSGSRQAFLDESAAVSRDDSEDRRMAESGRTAGTDLLMLVNKDHGIPEGYRVNLHWLENGTSAVAEEMYGPLSEMLSDGADAGGKFVVASAYRSREYQRQLLEEDVRSAMEQDGLTWQEAYDRESRETMPAGYSEHETGLAADIVSLDYQLLDSGQEDTFENRWLREHCSEYGFILRYPNGKERITGIDYEPWHFRYVGKEPAREIMSRGITLEEYLEEQEDF